MRALRRPTIALFILLGLPAASAFAQVAVPTAVAPPPEADGLPVEGTGLCISVATSANPGVDFALNETQFNGGMNSFFDMRQPNTDRTDQVHEFALDLSNNHSVAGDDRSFGDFRLSEPGNCPPGGCSFCRAEHPICAQIAANPTNVSFGGRLRGFFLVTEELVGQDVHFGLYADDAVSLTFFDRANTAFPILIRQPDLFTETWRLTETVRFGEPGLYPVEILYVEGNSHAALEMSVFVGQFADFELPAPSSIPLNSGGFSLLAETSFYHTPSGAPSFATSDVSGQDPPDQCRQCNRTEVNLPGNGGCGSGSGRYCNEAALCAPCDSADFCGPQCSPCGIESPFCININGSNQCAQCIEDEHCGPGQFCSPEGTCEQCDTDNSCAGQSCNCCPVGPSGRQMTCEVIEDGSAPVCVECTSNEDCATGLCDLFTGHCVDRLHPNQSPDRCGDDGVPCPDEFPFCLPGPFGTACAECRWDTDCATGDYCLSGVCLPCLEDKRCGVRCTSCGGDTPFCLDRQTPERSLCVECTDNAQCPGGTCNPLTFQCENTPDCAMSCGGATPFCFDDQCVECFADTQCPCGGTCDSVTLSCSKACSTSRDCLGNEHCRWNDEGTEKECELGPLVEDVTCGGTLADTCAITVGRGDDDSSPWTPWLIGLAALALLRRRMRGAR